MAEFEKGAVDLGSLFYSQDQLAPTGPSAHFHKVSYGPMLSRFNHSANTGFAVKLEALAGLGQSRPAPKTDTPKIG